MKCLNTTSRAALCIVALLFLAACSDSVTGVEERYLSLPGGVSLRTIDQAGSQCLATNDGALIGDPLANATVTAIHQSGDLGDMITATDAAGDARLDLLTGIYDLRIEADGYVPITVEGIYVEPDSATDLGDFGLRKEGGNSAPEFNQDRAVLLSMMAVEAYELPEDPDLIQPEPKPDPKAGNEAGDYFHCWELLASDYEDTFFGPATELFIARNKDTQDLVVSFKGSNDIADYLDDANAFKETWWLRDGTAVENAVHKGFRDSYLVAQTWLEVNLKQFIRQYVDDPTTARIYFTGHSLGGALATLAALDLSPWLQDQFQYDRQNIIMYSFGAPRSVTEELASDFDDDNPSDTSGTYRRIVRHSFAVAAKDDYIPHFFGEAVVGPDFRHIENLVVANTNITLFGTNKEFYSEIGATRIDNSAGRRFEGCIVDFIGDDDRDVNETMPSNRDSVYGKRGHDQETYITRMLNIVSGGIPKTELSTGHTGTFGGNRLWLNWTGGVHGPCDWIALYETVSDDPPTDSNEYKTFVSGWEWAVRGEKQDDTDCYATPDKCRHETDKNPDGDDDVIFWAGYVDGFGGIRATDKL